MKFRFAAAVLAAAVTASFAAAPAISAEAAHFESRTMEVKVVKDKVQLIPDVVYSQVASRGFQNVALKMDLLVPQNKAKKARAHLRHGRRVHQREPRQRDPGAPSHRRGGLRRGEHQLPRGAHVALPAAA
jgi:hypothetical protein